MTIISATSKSDIETPVEKALDLQGLRFCSLEPGCDLSGFSCGEDVIDQWARKRAHDEHEKFKGRVVTVYDAGKATPVGLYSLTLVLERQRDIKKQSDVSRWVTNGMFPSLHLEYLCVSQDYQRQGLGKVLTMDAITTFSHLAEKVGLPILTLIPLRRELEPFYAARNFVPYSRGMMMRAETAIALRDGTPAEAVQ